MTKPKANDKLPKRRFNNRELSWLMFNTRVLEEANNTDYPLLERLRFLSISASNLDEFFMVRVAGLIAQVRAGHNVPSQDGLTPQRQLEKIRKRALKLIHAQQESWTDLQKKLYKTGIKVKAVADLSDSDMDVLRRKYTQEIMPLLTPIAVDSSHPFPFIQNLGFGLVLSLADKNKTDNLRGLIPIPSNVARFIRIQRSSGGKSQTYVAIEDVLEHFAADLFVGRKVTGCGLFRITRDSDIEVDEKAEDLVLHFESLIKKRRRGRVIRLRLEKSCPQELKDFLVDSFEAGEQDVYEMDGLMGLTGLSQLITKDRPDLTFAPFTARFPERIREHDGDCFAAISQKDILVHHPYEEFDVVVQFLQQAALDPDVVAIKQTLYRVSDDSPIVKALIEAAERGKTVTALVELKARFDEETNMRWARNLERAGAHVVYGFMELKTHAKVSLVLRREGRTLRSYTHLGTGNYHAQNAKVYTDLALFTVDKTFGNDVGQVFNYVTSYAPPKNLEKLVIAPIGLRETLMMHINEEIAHAKAGRPATIWAKMNALVDPKIIKALYRASQAGVQIDLVVRGICCLRPGIEGLSENIRVKSIVGRFLEHARIVCFGNGQTLPSKDAHVYFSSADWMPRNLNRRVETLIPVHNPTVRRQVMNQIMVANLADETNSWDLLPTGKYARRDVTDIAKPFSAHQYFMDNPSLSGRGKSLKYDSPQDPRRSPPQRQKSQTNDNKPAPKPATKPTKPVQAKP